MVNEPKDYWGGEWTKQKLIAFEKYVRAYQTIMQNYNFKTFYFDGFAGSGSALQNNNLNNTIVTKQVDFFDSKDSQDFNFDTDVYRGSAERIIRIKSSELKPFTKYYFVDKDTKAISELENKLTKINDGKNLEFINDDVNVALTNFSKELKQSRFNASLIFLDPFGMQIDWSSIEQLNGTRTDIWILVPTGVIINRLLENSGKLTHINKLESFFGLSEEEIQKEFYTEIENENLFGENEKGFEKNKNSIEKIANLYQNRLQTIWKKVTKPMPLYNTRKVPIYHLIFASNNQTALKIASYLTQ